MQNFNEGYRAPATNGTERPKRSSLWPLISILLGLALLGGLYMLARNQGWLGLNSGSAEPNSKLYQAVFLSNGLVYFGKVTTLDNENLVLEDIYYLQATQPLQQQPAGSGSNTNAANNQEPQLNLIKMGSEIHGPSDKMVVPKYHVVFWEDIKSDGTVAKAIEEYKSKK